jgi:hypothetical protein
MRTAAFNRRYLKSPPGAAKRAAVMLLCTVLTSCDRAPRSTETAESPSTTGAPGSVEEKNAAEAPMSADEILSSCAKSLVIVWIMKHDDQPIIQRGIRCRRNAF